MKDKFLPIGTVVLLKGGSKKVMITGYLQVTEAKKDVMFDYRGCPFPEGVLASSGVALFNKNDIEEIVHMGYENPESKDFLEKIEKMIK